MRSLKKSDVTRRGKPLRIGLEGGDANPSQLEDLAWLGEVREVTHPINFLHPLIVRESKVQTGAHLQPAVPHPERHPYCEINWGYVGSSLQFIGSEKIQRKASTLMLIGPGTPHYALRTHYPQRSIIVHFLPILLFEMGPEGDGARMLARFTVPKKIEEKVLRVPAPMASKFNSIFEEMVVAFESGKPGSEFRLRALLMEIFLELMRWEESIGRTFDTGAATQNWLQVERVLRFIHEHYAEPIYIKQIARVVGLTVWALQTIFRGALGMSCIQYIRAYRISRAAALLCSPNARVTEVAFEAGFETLSHFNTSFRELMGMSPKKYAMLNAGKSTRLSSGENAGGPAPNTSRRRSR